MTVAVAYLIQDCCIFKDTLRFERQTVAICREICASCVVKTAGFQAVELSHTVRNFVLHCEVTGSSRYLVGRAS